MTNQAKNVPELRFPEFDGEWEEKKLGDIAHITMGQSPKSSNYTNNNQDMVLVQGNADMKKGQIYPRIYTTEITKLAEIDDILLSVRAPVGELAIAQLRACIGRGVCAINANKFVYYNLELFKVRNTWKLFSQGSTFESISGNEIKKIKFQIPTSESEQEKIGEFFGKLDQQIELEEQKLEKLEEQKKGYMQKIFSQQLRFKDENGNDYPKWENKQLGNLVDITMGQSPSSKNYTENSNYTTLVQGNADLNNGYIEPRIYTKQITKLAEVNDILLTVRAPVGKIGRAQLKACIGRGVCAIKGDSFIYYFLELFDLQNKWIRFSQGSTFESISGNEIKNIDIAYPVNEERQKISEFLSKLDKLLKNQLLKVEQLKQRKQGLLQKMFI
ncbi:restriction endonuclease subunit S [Mammaliicoccus sp. R-M63]|uniref:restriction endonuclease subunit S n=1 Tax=Mammaliicoccus sp. R-M63 TaxID=2898722 RepID=UPI001EFA8DE6|nr:restriction endonuclease subunit S [Mammaliicoccus sp. R-M63]